VSARHHDVTVYSLRYGMPLAVFFVLFFVTPLLLLVLVSLHDDTAVSVWGLAQYAKIFGDGLALRVLGDTLWLGVQVTLLCLLLGYALAWAYVRSSPTVQKVLMMIIVMPLLTSVVVRTFAWVVILGRQGIVNELLLGWAWIERPLRLLYSREGLIWALAAALGANAWRTFRRITLPLSLPGIIAGSLLTFSATITAFITQSLVGGGQMLFMPMYIYQQASALQNWPYAAAISLVFLVAVIGCVTLLSYLGRLSKGYATT
jgi:putative spermidine/putrescine transport system permease protein